MIRICWWDVVDNVNRVNSLTEYLLVLHWGTRCLGLLPRATEKVLDVDRHGQRCGNDTDYLQIPGDLRLGSGDVVHRNANSLIGDCQPELALK